MPTIGGWRTIGAIGRRGQGALTSMLLQATTARLTMAAGSSLKDVAHSLYACLQGTSQAAPSGGAWGATMGGQSKRGSAMGQ